MYTVILVKVHEDNKRETALRSLIKKETYLSTGLFNIYDSGTHRIFLVSPVIPLAGPIRWRPLSFGQLPHETVSLQRKCNRKHVGSHTVLPYEDNLSNFNAVYVRDNM